MKCQQSLITFRKRVLMNKAEMVNYGQLSKIILVVNPSFTNKIGMFQDEPILKLGV